MPGWRTLSLCRPPITYALLELLKTILAATIRKPGEGLQHPDRRELTATICSAVFSHYGPVSVVYSGEKKNARLPYLAGLGLGELLNWKRVYVSFDGKRYPAADTAQPRRCSCDLRPASVWRAIGRRCEQTKPQKFMLV